MTTPPKTTNQETHCMGTETNRFNTFTGWPLSFIKPAHLARAGFYYTKKADIVKCAYCSIEIGHWQEGDDITTDHRKWSPNCIFLKGGGGGGASEMPANDSGEDTCGRYGIHQYKPNSFPEGMHAVMANLNGLGIQQNRGAAYPNYAIYENRLLSFAVWPPSIKQKPVDLADAGFFYTGKGDQTMCFSCGGGLKHWEENDVPWEQHALWFPKCSYLLLKKSRAYVETIQNRQRTEEASATLSSTPPPSTSDPTRKPEETSLATTTTTQPPSLSEVAAAAVVSENNTKESSDDASNNTNSGNSRALCKICYSKEVGAVFLPCGHVVACVDCAPPLTQCAVCRIPLEATIRAYLS